MMGIERGLKLALVASTLCMAAFAAHADSNEGDF